MNWRIVSRYMGHFAYLIGLFMVPSVAWAVWFREWDAFFSFLASIAIAVATGGALRLIGRSAPNNMNQREALGLVSISWILAATVGGLPFLIDGVLGPVDAYFESMSGFTTTGSTTIQDIESVPKSILFWRSFTQWLGGMGIVVLFIAVLPYLGAGGKQLFRSESPGPDPRGLSPKIKDTASILYKIYVALTAMQTLALMAVGLNFYEALTHTLSTVSSGGFSPKQASIAHYDSVAVEAIVIIFMGAAGTNFAIFFAMLRRDIYAPLKDPEWRTYVIILVVAMTIISLNLFFAAPAGSDLDSTSVLHAVRVAAFQVVSIVTTTGFGTSNFDEWPNFSRMLIVTLMFLGGCAGSTAGGMKIVRMVILAKIAYWRVENTFRPKTIRAIRVGDHVITDDVQKTVTAFFILYISWLIGGSLFMALLGLPTETAVTSVVTTVNNVGPGLEAIGPAADFSTIPAVGKLFLSLCMALGRLEVFAIFVLFVPSFWKHS